MNLTPQEKIEIFKNIFRGREDVFVMYWEKADKSAKGYTKITRTSRVVLVYAVPFG